MTISQNDVDTPSVHDVRTAVQILEADRCLIIPTETFFGLAASVFSSAGCALVYQAKKRSASKPLPLIAADTDVEVVPGVAADRQSLCDFFFLNEFLDHGQRQGRLWERRIALRQPQLRLADEPFDKAPHIRAPRSMFEESAVRADAMAERNVNVEMRRHGRAENKAKLT